MSDVKSKFEAALAQRKKQKVEEASRGGFSGAGFPEIPYAPLYTGKQQAFRFVGLPYSVREKPTDSKRIHVAMILGDDDKKFRCIGPDPAIHKDWILYRVIAKVLTRHWDKNIPGSGGTLGAYVYDYATVHPELYNRVAKNNNVESNIERGWKFNPCILFNVIDRANYAWHKENKKYRVLSKRASEWQDKVFFEVGVPDTLFQIIMDDIVAGDGNTNWEDYDIVVNKLSDKPWYKALHGIDHIKYLDEEVKTFIVNKGLTDEERSWELNNFDSLYSQTRYSKIKSRLGLFFQKVDKVFNTKYYDELLLLVDKEEVELADKQMQENSADDYNVPQGEASEATSVQPNAMAPQAPQTAPQATQTAPQAPVAINAATTAVHPVRGATADSKPCTPMTDEIWAKLADGTYNGKKYLGVPTMKPHEKNFVLGIYDDGSFKWHPDAGELYEGSSSGFITAQECGVDPLDGTVF